MDVSLKASFLVLFLLFSAANGQLESGSSMDPLEKSRQFHIDQNTETREFLKSEMDAFFVTLWDSLSQKLAESNLETLSKLETLEKRIIKLEGNQEELSANLSRNINESMSNLHWNLSESLHEGLARSVLKTETSFLNLSETLSRKVSATELNMEKSFANLSGLLSGELRRNQLSVESGFRNLTESVGRTVGLLTKEWNVTVEPETPDGTTVDNMPQPSSVPTPSTSLPTVESGIEVVPTLQPPTTTEVEEIHAEEGTLEFCGGANLHLRRKIWVLRSEGGEFRRAMRFQLEENGLRKVARLSLWGSAYEDGGQHVWNGTQRDWAEERWSWGQVILVTLLISAGGVETPSFKLKFNTTHTERYHPYFSEVVWGEGRHVVSFPPNNTHDYPGGSDFVAVVAAPSGGPFGLTLTFLDLPGTHPDCKEASFDISFLEESSTVESYKRLPPSAHRRCGKVDGILEPLGNFTVVIARFINYHNKRFGRGFRLEVN